MVSKMYLRLRTWLFWVSMLDFTGGLPKNDSPKNHPVQDVEWFGFAYNLVMQNFQGCKPGTVPNSKGDDSYIFHTVLHPVDISSTCTCTGRSADGTYLSQAASHKVNKPATWNIWIKIAVHFPPCFRENSATNTCLKSPRIQSREAALLNQSSISISSTFINLVTPWSLKNGYQKWWAFENVVPLKHGEILRNLCRMPSTYTVFSQSLHPDCTKMGSNFNGLRKLSLSGLVSLLEPQWGPTFWSLRPERKSLHLFGASIDPWSPKSEVPQEWRTVQQGDPANNETVPHGIGTSTGVTPKENEGKRCRDISGQISIIPEVLLISYQT